MLPSHVHTRHTTNESPQILLLPFMIEHAHTLHTRGIKTCDVPGYQIYITTRSYINGTYRTYKFTRTYAHMHTLVRRLVYKLYLCQGHKQRTVVVGCWGRRYICSTGAKKGKTQNQEKKRTAHGAHVSCETPSRPTDTYGIS